MSSPERLGRSRHVVAGFVAITGVLILLLGWLSWRFIALEKDLETQRIQERLELATDSTVSALAAGIVETERWLRSLLGASEGELSVAGQVQNEALPSDSLIVFLTAQTLTAHPRSHLLYYPFPDPAQDGVPDELFAAVDGLEFREKDYVGAAAMLRDLSRSEDSAVRVAALLRLARVLRKAGDSKAALAVYEDLELLEGARVEDLPAGLLARYNRCELLAELGRPDELQADATGLLNALGSGRWHLTAPVYRFYSEQVSGWLGAHDRGIAEVADLEALAAAVEEIWRRRDQNGTAASVAGVQNRWILWAQERPFVILEASDDTTRALLIAGPRFAEQHWLAAWLPFGERQGVEIGFIDVASGRRLYGATRRDAGAADETRLGVARTPAETGLPWSVHVTSSDPATERASMAMRRNLLLLGLALVISILFTSVYFIGRAVNREFEVARVQSDFVAAVSHEFRSPLTSMRHLIELLATDRVPDEPSRERFYEVLGRETKRLQRLVEQLLDFRRMDEGAMELTMQPVDASELVEKVAAEFRDEMSALGYTLEVAINGLRPVLRGDQDALARALWNLLENAVRYSSDCNTVWLEVAEAEDGRLAIKVRDRGVGIAEEEQAAIFKKFVRGSSSQNLGARGTGLGLAMVVEIVRAHGGEVRLESEVGRGSMFTIMLPLEKAPQ